MPDQALTEALQTFQSLHGIDLLRYHANPHAFYEDIVRFNTMYNLPCSASGFLSPGPDRIAQFQSIFGEEVEEGSEVGEAVGLCDWLGDMIVYLSSERLRWGLSPAFVVPQGRDFAFVHLPFASYPYPDPLPDSLISAQELMHSLQVKVMGFFLEEPVEESLSGWLDVMAAEVSKAALVWEIPLGFVLAIIMQSNFSKLAADGSVLRDDRGKVLKGPNYWAPEAKIGALLDILQDAKRWNIPGSMP